MIHKLKNAYLQLTTGEKIPLGEFTVVFSCKTHVTQNCFEKPNHEAHLKEHGEALLYDLGWLE